MLVNGACPIEIKDNEKGLQIRPSQKHLPSQQEKSETVNQFQEKMPGSLRSSRANSLANSPQDPQDKDNSSKPTSSRREYKEYCENVPISMFHESF